MIDIHAHLNFPPLYDQIDKVVAESKKAGLTGIIIGSSNLADSEVSIELAKKYPGFLYASVGIHPQKTDPKNKQTSKEQLETLDKLIAESFQLTAYGQQIVAIGETGLDFSPAPPGEEDRNKEEQEELFLGQIELALKYNLPLVIHAREAVDEVINILGNLSNLRGVFHCYAGGKKRITKVLALPGEWYFSFDGNITYDLGLTGIIPVIPTERILIETDSPFLAPEPFRGQTNTPAYLPYTQKKINEIVGKDLTSQILQNTKTLFFKKKERSSTTSTKLVA